MCPGADRFEDLANRDKVIIVADLPGGHNRIGDAVRLTLGGGLIRAT